MPSEQPSWKCILKIGWVNTRLENYFYHFKIITYLVIQKHSFFKNNNKIIRSKISQYEYQNPFDLIPFIVAYHDPSTTSRIRQSVLGWLYIGLWSLHRQSTQLILWQSSQTELTDSPSKVQHPTPTSSQTIMQ